MAGRKLILAQKCAFLQRITYFKFNEFALVLLPLTVLFKKKSFMDFQLLSLVLHLVFVPTEHLGIKINEAGCFRETIPVK